MSVPAKVPMKEREAERVLAMRRVREPVKAREAEKLVVTLR